MIDFNGVPIKTPEDFQEAIQIECPEETFIQQCRFWIEYKGIDTFLVRLYYALYGDSDSKMNPLIKTKPYEHVDEY